MKTNKYKEAVAAGMKFCYTTPADGWKYFLTRAEAEKAMKAEKKPTTLYDIKGKRLTSVEDEDYL